MRKDIDKETSDRIWIMKAMAVVAIVACHCTQVSENAGAINKIATLFFEKWIYLGVPVFYFLSGYVSNFEVSGKIFLLRKLKTIIIPWLLTGTVVWLYVVLRKGGISLNEWFLFVIGRKSYLYFLTDLIIFQAFFYSV